MTRRRDEVGQAGVLVVGFFLVAVLLVIVVVDASAAYLRRQRLDAVADGAALAATEGLEADQVYLGGLEERARIDPVEARRHVSAYLRQVRAHRSLPGLMVTVRTTGGTVVVRARAPLDLPFAPPGWAERTTVTGSAASYVEVVE
jgi:hypothetical protein